MPFQIVRDDIIRMPVDAIVCPTDSRLSGSGGLDASVHIAAGPKMAEECRKLGGCPVGEARLVPGFWLSRTETVLPASSERFACLRWSYFVSLDEENKILYYEDDTGVHGLKYQ